MVSRRFEGKAVIVTGSSNGIGRETARLFAAAGAKVTLAGRNTETLEESRQELLKAGANESDIAIVQGDVADDAVIQALIDKTLAAFGRIDVLVNNAASLEIGKGNAAEMDISCFDQIVRVNVRQVILLTQLAAPHLAKTRGAVINISSIVSHPHEFHHHPFYSITKAALDQVTVQFASVLIKQGIRVNSINPGLIITDIFQKAGFTENTNGQFFNRMNDPNTIPIGRHGKPDDIAKAILFLADRSESEFIVGQKIYVDGGSTFKNVLLEAMGSFEAATHLPIA